ncbi:hypothetical protein ABG768_018925 [Culter alburnus]|uniref:Myb/SANT-like DNA-binding domain-containing protein n=1 Tax=Culter alburnus TaxID=194366 RepID=A0AAW2AX37_CULAL
MTDERVNNVNVSSSAFKWSDEHTEHLITWRTTNDAVFTGKRNAAIKGFETFIEQSNLQGKVSAAWVKKKWENLKQKYKDLKCPQTGVSTEGGESTAASWKWYGVMDAALGCKPSITPPLLIQSGSKDIVNSSSSSVAGPSDLAPTNRTRRSEGDLLTYLKEMEEKEAKREEEAQQREERRTRELEERETRRYEETKQREEEARRREDEFRVRMLRREEMRDEEMRRREAEMRREVAAREERFLSLMEVLAKSLSKND